MILESYKVSSWMPRRSQFGVPDFVCVCVFCFNHAFVGFFFHEFVVSLKSVRSGWIAEELVLQRLG